MPHLRRLVTTVSSILLVSFLHIQLGHWQRLLPRRWCAVGSVSDYHNLAVTRSRQLSVPFAAFNAADPLPKTCPSFISEALSMGAG